jgi:predicted nucleic acid-binding protein
MILLDTNVISETFRPTPEPRIGRWMTAIPIDRFFVSSITIAELLYGLAIMPEGQRKHALGAVLQVFLAERIINPIQSFDDRDAAAYASISAHRRRMGRQIRELDAQIAAIALTRGLSVATRNVRDFEDCGIEIINPWDTAAA